MCYLIERENDLKTEFLLSRRDFPNDKVIDEKPYENIQENEIFDSNLWESEPIFIEIEEKGYMKKAFEKKCEAKDKGEWFLLAITVCQLRSYPNTSLGSQRCRH